MLELLPTSKVCSTCKNDLLLEDFGSQKRGLYGRKSECKKCLSKKEAARRATDPEAYRKYQREWWASHPKTEDDKIKAAEKARAWYSRNKSRHLANWHRWIKENQDAFKVIQKKYLVKNPVHIRRKAYMDKIERTLTQEQWDDVLKAFNHCCAYCLQPKKLTMDHVIPVSKGGPHTAENVVPSCKSCNSRKGARPLFVMLSAA